MLLDPALGLAADRWQTDGLVGYATDYIDRGISQSDRHGAVRAEVGWRHDHGYGVRLSAATVDFGEHDDAVAELNVIGGREWQHGPVVLATSLAYVHFAGVDPSEHYDLVEWAGDIVYEVRDWQLDLQAVYSPNESGRVGQAVYVAAGAGRRLTESLALRLHGGRQWFDREEDAGDSYHDWGLGLVWTHGRMSYGVGYTDTDLGSACRDICDERIALTLELAL
jgi:uncharacterized protein (TIGR02001 family)